MLLRFVVTLRNVDQFERKRETVDAKCRINRHNLRMFSRRSRRSRCDSFVKDTTEDDDQPQGVTELATGGVFIFALQLVNRVKHSSYIRGHHCQK